MPEQKKNIAHKPLRTLLSMAESGDAQAQFELSLHPFLGKEDRFYWLVKAAQKEHVVACVELERVQLERDLADLYEKASLGHLDAAYALGVHPKLDPRVQHNWLTFAAGRGHKQASDALHRIDILVERKENIPVPNNCFGGRDSFIH